MDVQTTSVLPYLLAVNTSVCVMDTTVATIAMYAQEAPLVSPQATAAWDATTATLLRPVETTVATTTTVVATATIVVPSMVTAAMTTAAMAVDASVVTARHLTCPTVRLLV